jgi:hypothetical protein
LVSFFLVNKTDKLAGFVLIYWQQPFPAQGTRAPVPELLVPQPPGLTSHLDPKGFWVLELKGAADVQHQSLVGSFVHSM